MTKRAVGWIGAMGLLLAGLCALVLGRGVLMHAVRREFRGPLFPAAHAAPDTSQIVTPRTPDFLQPQRLDAWRIIGPGGGGTFHNPSISPHDPNLVFASTDMTACYVSENGGRTWRTFNLRRTCSFVFDPKLPNRVWAIASGLWRSDDRGHTWNLVYPDGKATVVYLDDEGDPFLFSSAGYVANLGAMAVDPDDSDTLYGSMNNYLQVSQNGGKTWKGLAQDLDAQQLWIDPTSPRGNRVVYTRLANIIATWDGSKYTKRTIEGIGPVSWAVFGTPSGGGKPVMYVAGGYVVKDGKQIGGILASNDGGQTWRSLTENILKISGAAGAPVVPTVGTSRKHAEVLYVSVNGFVPLTDRKQGYFGVLKSTDSGVTWAPVRLEVGTIAANMHNDWTSSRFGPDYGEEPVDIGVDDNNPDLVYTGDLGRIMRTVDGGKSWYGVFTQSTGSGYATTGLDVTTCYGIHIDPFNPKNMLISYTDIGLMRSEDGGESWLGVNMTGLPGEWRHNTYWVEFDPAVKGKVWAVMSSRHDLPRQRMLNLYGGGRGGVAESVDGGRTWTASSHGLPPIMSPTHILLDPKSPETARVLYLTAFGIGVFKSKDGGKNWELKNAGLPEKAPLTWRMAIASDGTLYVVTIRRSVDGKYGNDQDGWLFRSRDGAESWERVPLPEGVNGPTGITVDPKDPSRLFVSTWLRYKLYLGDIPPNGGVYMSPDGGRSWQYVLNGSHRIYDVTVDPRDSNLAYAAGFDASAWRSTDRGKTWSRIGGYNFRGGHRVITDPTDINKIYITTFGNSVWHGPAAGDPKAPEDIVSPPTMTFQAAWKK